MCLRRTSGVILAFLCGLATQLVCALPEDRAQAIHITADQALRDEKRGLTIYRGNVQLDQGSLRIFADRITIFRIVEDGDKIVAVGKPARLQQQLNVGEELMRAQAGIIEYYKNEDRVHLKDGAHLEQGGSTVTGETIDYFISQQLVKASSDEDRENSRVEVVIPANMLEKKKDTSGNTDSK